MEVNKKLRKLMFLIDVCFFKWLNELQISCPRILRWNFDSILRKEKMRSGRENLQRTGSARLATGCVGSLPNRRRIGFHSFAEFGASRRQTGQHPHLGNSTSSHEIIRFWI